MPSIQIFGDSIAHGGRDLERGGWPLRIRRHMSAHGLGDAGFVQARSGDTSFDVCKRMPIEIALRGSETVIIAIGTNDAQILGDS
ncbi:MAG: GDSL-type esterase/lipase family protein [Spirochaetaceae bacterium]